ncbi:MAG: DUF4097 family beta strand repeat protein [Clostridia bacterium]|nr:DUF4097 family beta strand repeat protein [Clostridia bacterium]
MKKRTVIIALLMVFIGITLIAGGCFAMGFDFRKLDNHTYTERSIEITEAFENIVIAKGSDISLLPSEDGKCRAVFTESDTVTYSSNVEDGTLTIKRSEDRKWLDYFGFNFTSYNVKLYLPETKYNYMNIKTFSGDIELSEGLTFHHVNLDTASGDIRCYAAIDDNLFAETSSGDMDIRGINARGITLSVTSGRIKLSGIDSAVKIDISSTSGSIHADNVACENFEIRSSSGVSELNSVIASGKIKIKSTSGGIRFDGCDANEFDVRSTSGDIEGTLKSDKVFNVHATSGSIDVPETIEADGTFNADVTSGDVKITIE